MKGFKFKMEKDVIFAISQKQLRSPTSIRKYENFFSRYPFFFKVFFLNWELEFFVLTAPCFMKQMNLLVDFAVLPRSMNACCGRNLS